MNPKFPIHVRTLTGLENILAEEMIELGAEGVEKKSRLVVCQGDLRMLYKLNLWCRFAIRVMRPLLSIATPDEKAFYEAVQQIDWSQWMSSTGTLAVNANLHSSFTTHSLFLAQLAKDAVVDQFRAKTGERPSVDLEEPDLRIGISLYKNTTQIYLDASGESLHKRGYRQRAGQAPLNETLAAGIIKLSGWDGSTPFIDPMVGSGTFAIEAGLMVKNIAPGLLRNYFGFLGWPDFDSKVFEELVNEAKALVRQNVEATIIGVEIDPAVAQIARDNVARANVQDVVKIERSDFFTWNAMPKAPGTLVVNPPYDERLKVDKVGELWERLGIRLKESYGGWKASVLCGNPEVVRFIPLTPHKSTLLYNGSIECRLFNYQLKAPLVAEKEAAMRATAPVNPKWKEKAEVFANRIRKTQKHYGKRVQREGITSWRVYDRDIPELPFMVDLYGNHLHFAEVPRNHEHSPLEHIRYMELMVNTAAQVLNVATDKVHFKKRRLETTEEPTGKFIEVPEGGHKFLVNLSDYVDVGLFLEQRNLRSLVEKEAKGKDFLNLFSYTGSLSVYAAAGGAKSTTSVDSSRTYLEWAEKNMQLNQFSGTQHRFVRNDTLEFLEQAKATFDICVVDPPARSVNRNTGSTFDVQADHVRLLHLVLERIRPKGKVFFSTNYRSFTLNDMGIKSTHPVEIKEITKFITPMDFEKNPGQRCWMIEVGK